MAPRTRRPGRPPHLLSALLVAGALCGCAGGTAGREAAPAPPAAATGSPAGSSGPPSGRPDGPSPAPPATGGPGGSPVPAPTGTAPAGPAAPAPGGPPDQVTAVGRVAVDRDRGCLVLRASGRTFALVGPLAATLVPGARIQVVGVVALGPAPPCGTAVPLRVGQIRPAG